MSRGRLGSHYSVMTRARASALESSAQTTLEGEPESTVKQKRHVRVGIVGGGFAGIAAAARLKREGHQDFDVFEQSDGPGGTWRDATYPGAAVDTPQPMYSYSFTRNQSFSRLFAAQPELLAYLEQTVDDFGLRPHFHFNIRVLSAEWSESRHAYTLRLSNGEERIYEVLVSAVGFLNNPRLPDWPHLDEFSGEAFHSARWNPVELRGKRVALVGTGSGAVQIASAIAAEVDELLIFQREPGWVLPKPDRVFTPQERARFARPWRRRHLRRLQYIDRENGGFEATGSGLRALLPRRKKVDKRKYALDYIDQMFSERDDLRQAVTPQYVYGGKRVIKDSNYYPALLRDNVRLIPHAVDDAYVSGVIDALGDKHEVDVLIMATGYHASKFLATLPVEGRRGRTLEQVWHGEPTAFLGMTVPEFPNFFIMYGPNTNSVHLTYLFESQARYIGRCVKLLQNGARAVEVRQFWHDSYTRRIDDKLKDSAFAKAVKQGVHSYFATDSGRIVGIMPMRNVTYSLLLRALGRPSLKVRR